MIKSIEQINNDKDKLYKLLKHINVPPKEFKTIFNTLNKYVEIIMLIERANVWEYDPLMVIDMLVNIIGEDL